MTRKYICIVPFWPLAVIDTENYFLLPAIVAKKKGFDASIFILSTNSRIKNKTCQGVPLKFFSSVFELYKSLPREAILHVQTIYKTMFLLLCLLFLKRKSYQVIWTPHISFGKGTPCNLPFNFFRAFFFIFKHLDSIASISRYEEGYLKKLGYKNVFYLPLVVDENRFNFSEPIRRKQSFNLLFLGGWWGTFTGMKFFRLR